MSCLSYKLLETKLNGGKKCKNECVHLSELLSVGQFVDNMQHSGEKKKPQRNIFANKKINKTITASLPMPSLHQV